MNTKIWFITGISSGLGAALANTVMHNGGFVVGTFRNQAMADLFNTENKGKGFGLVMDITHMDKISGALEQVIQKFGKIDVLVNNAGFGFAGAIEETTIEETREVFEANFFGALKLTQKLLPFFRKQKGGHIIQISSHGGFKAFAGFGIYNASKFALEGFSEALALEVAPLGIKVTIVEPGPFRTSFAGSSFRESKKTIEDYNETAALFRQRIKAVNGNQEGDPEKGAKAIFDIASMDNPPLRLPLGKIALTSLMSKLVSVQSDLEEYKEIAEACVFLEK